MSGIKTHGSSLEGSYVIDKVRRLYPDERKEVQVIDWYKFFAKTRYTQRDWVRARIAANSWVTCAVGVQCAAIPRDMYGVPKDYELASLGAYFNNAIAKMACFAVLDQPFEVYKKIAMNILSEIEARSSKLLLLQHIENEGQS